MPPPSAPESLLATALSVAVPMWAMELRRRPLDELLAEAPSLAQIVAEKGDLIQFRGKKRGETAAAFNALARGVAILSFVPGGVIIFGMHFENVHPDTDKSGCSPVHDADPSGVPRVCPASLASRSKSSKTLRSPQG
jgi:hypothetical protein